MSTAEGKVLPTRVHHLELARRRFGSLADKVLPALWRVDPLADAVARVIAEQPSARRQFQQLLETGSCPDAPEALRSFFGELDAPPDWVDWARLDRAGQTLFRSAAAGGIVLGAKSLCYGYCSPGGNKPLIMTGRLSNRSIGMRLAETSRYVVETCRPGGLERFGEGFKIGVHVRLMHASVRLLLWRSPHWQHEAWGEPINQHDMLGTALLFSYTLLDGLRQFGFHVSADEAADYLHLWRYASHIMGLEAQLFPRDEAEAVALTELYLLTMGKPDQDSQTLVHSLIESPRQAAVTPEQARLAQLRVAMGYGLCRSLLGRDLADALALPRTPWQLLLPASRALIVPIEGLRRTLPGLGNRLERLGHRYWDLVIAEGLAGKKPRYRAPGRLAQAFA